MTSRSIKNAINYNEKKLQEAKATLIHAERYLKDAGQLSFKEKLLRLQRLAEMNERTLVNCVHISLNFDPQEAQSLCGPTLVAIANTYMHMVGFGEQPYLVYQHLDAGHPHIHIVSTNIKADGSRIALHNIGKNQSDKARKEIEDIFHLIPAESKRQQRELRPVAKKVIYGETETNAGIASVVTAVVRDYKFSSLTQLNAVLSLYNVLAYRGKEESAMYRHKGLVYFVTDDKGKRISVPICARMIYSRPTLRNLERKFIANGDKKAVYKEALRKSIDRTIGSGFIADKEALKEGLKKQYIDIVFLRDRGSVIYIDQRTKAVFDGVDLGREYGARRLMERIGTRGLKEQEWRKQNASFAERLLKVTDYEKGVSCSLASLYSRGLRVETDFDEEGKTIYLLGKNTNPKESFYPADRKLTAWFVHNHLTSPVIRKINDAVDRYQDIEDTANSIKTDLAHQTEHTMYAYLNGLISLLLSDEYPVPAVTIDSQAKKKKGLRP